MSVTQQLVISNHGNASARYKWLIPQSGAFVPDPIIDQVAAGSSKNVKVTFKPTGQRSEEELLILQIEDGNSIDVKCQGIVNEAKCTFIEKLLDFGNIPVGLRAKDQTIHIKNQMRSTAIFHIECNSEELNIQPKKGRIGPDSKMVFTAGFISMVEQDFQTEIIVHVRGGK